MAKKAIIIYGPPGAGKGTQANLLAWRKGFMHFDTGKYLEQLVHDPANKNNKTIQRERKLFDSGALMTPSFVLRVVSDKTQEIAKAGFSIVFSGSPRTVFEAYGQNADLRGSKRGLARIPGLIEILEKAYGKKNIYPILLDIDPNRSIERNAKRLVCDVCANAILYSDVFHKHNTCPLCGGQMKKRAVDNPAVFKTRIKEYQERTYPIIEGLKKRGYKIIKVDGKPMPFRVHEQILKKIKI